MVLSVPWVEVCRSVSVHLLFNDGLLYSPRSGADSCCNEEIALQCKGIEMPGCWECKALHGVCGVCGVWEGGRKKEGDKKKGGREGRKGGREGRKGGREGDKDFVVNVMEMATNCLHYVQCMRCMLHWMSTVPITCLHFSGYPAQVKHLASTPIVGHHKRT